MLPWLLVAAVVLATGGLPFFWDTLQLASRHAHFFYENRFESLFLPNDMDSGHIPAFGMYVALAWQLLGRSLWVSHLAMFPFVAGTLWFTRRIAGRLFPREQAWLVTLLMVADATLLAQFSLVSPDIWIACFFTMALWAFLEQKRKTMAVAFLFLALTSMRGMMIVAAFFLTEAILLFFNEKRRQDPFLRLDDPSMRPQDPSLQPQDSFLRPQDRSNPQGPSFPEGRSFLRQGLSILFRALPVYLPAALPVLLYLGAHFLRTGWVGYHPDMPWAEHFARVDLTGFLRNLLIFSWRLADQGRLFIWVTGAALLLRALRSRPGTTPDGRLLITLTLVLAAVFSYSALTYRNLAGHRYLLPLFLMAALTVSYHLFLFVANKRRVVLVLLFLLAGELSGHFWVYPDSIAKGWDASLAYLPYQPLRRDMVRFLQEKDVPPETVGTSFPNNISFKYIDLSDDTRSFGTAGEQGTPFRYLLWSNVFNDFPEALKAEAEAEWKVVRELRCVQVRMILYEKPVSAGAH